MNNIFFDISKLNFTLDIQNSKPEMESSINVKCGDFKIFYNEDEIDNSLPSEEYINDQENLSIALSKLAEEDPTFKVHSDEDSGQTIISGMGELHLEVIADRLKREFDVNVNIGNPQVSYKEGITKQVEQETEEQAFLSDKLCIIA